MATNRGPLFQDNLTDLYLAQMSVFGRQLMTQLQSGLQLSRQLKEMAEILAHESDSQGRDYTDLAGVLSEVTTSLKTQIENAHELVNEVETSLHEELATWEAERRIA